jgi:hypothetical protein
VRANDEAERVEQFGDDERENARTGERRPTEA